MISVCVPVLNRYDLLRKLLLSLKESTLQPEAVYVIDNGGNREALTRILEEAQRTQPELPILVYWPDKPMGVAESWNWFLTSVPEDRLIANDDIEFAPDSLEKMVASPLPFVSCGFGFSCFIVRDACVKAVGQFDGAISPGYAYFEDMDYLRRMKMGGVQDAVVQCGVKHFQSATPQAYTPAEANEHNRRFQIAEANYTRKWDNPPSWEQLRTIGGEGLHG